MNYISQYDDNMTKDKYKYNKIDTRYKWKMNASFPLLKLFKANYHVTVFNMSFKTIKNVETYKMIPK